ncbi:MAG: replicative DNA helicase [Alphaproteobacteria bacterium]|nr:replicative DNA helicase [Alphaproteobacteria bacterium]MBR6730762.1 replicative DNA helicase [Alphaproteobacteria bacterium]
MLEDTMRIPPQNLEAEQALLGAILSNNRAMEKVSDFLRAECFANPVHGRIFEACKFYIDQGRIADPITLKAYFEHDGYLKDVGGASYLMQLAAASATIINAGDYGKQILDRYIRRQMIALGNDVVNDAFAISLNEEAISQVEKAEKRLYEIANAGELSGGPQILNTALQATLESTQKAMNTPSGVSGVTTGLIEMDKLLGGLHDSDLLILAGRPAMGKSALALTIAYNAAVKFEEDNKKPGAEKKSVAFFSLEMSAEQLAGRILSAKAEVPGHQMRTGKLTDQQFDELAAGVALLSRVPLYLDETPGITVTAIKNRARRMKRDKEKGLGLIVIDYLQLINSAGRSENRVQELSEMTRQLKIMAKELNVPVLVLSQLSRLVEQRDNKRPQLSDLRESGSIEQDADIVMFVFREIYYLQNDVPVKHLNETPEKFALRMKEWEEKKILLANQAEAIIAKQRHGPVGTVKLYFNGEFGKFGNLEA